MCGGVYSGTGKGVASASIALLLKLRGHTVQYLKLDPYLNTSASILAPREHGESWVCDDGWECDLDLGHIERIANIHTSKRNICTSGVLYEELLASQDDFIGHSLQVVPHLTDLIIKKIETFKNEVEITIIEIGGTVGDIESSQFYEAVRQFKQRRDYVLVGMVAPVLWVPTISEFKTKPLQNAVRTLQQFGIQPDFLLCRTTKDAPKAIFEKISTFTNVPRECIFDAPDVETVYHVPLEFYARQIDDLIVDKFRLKRNACRIGSYREVAEKTPNEIIKVGVFGKYDGEEAYMSLKEALYHAAIANNVKACIQWINTEELEENPKLLNKLDIEAAVVPGGFDKRGIEGKIAAIKYIRKREIPFLGICLGLQCAIIEFSRNILKYKDANSLEFDKNTTNPVIHYVKGQEDIVKKLGTMRLGAYNCELVEGTLVRKSYGKKTISERHRHRYEVNSEYEKELEQQGFIVSGRNPETDLVEIMELDKKLHPFFVGTQFHPEFKSTLMMPAPLFSGLVKAAQRSFQV